MRIDYNNADIFTQAFFWCFVIFVSLGFISGIYLFWDDLFVLSETIVTSHLESIIGIGGLVFAAKDFRLATIYWFVISAGVFLWMYSWSASSGGDVDYYFSLVLMFISLVLMALNLLFIKKNADVVI